MPRGEEEFRRIAKQTLLAQAGQPGWMPALESTGYLPMGQLASGSPDATKFLRGDRTWATPPGGGVSAWGGITGMLSSQTDLQSALDAKAASSHTHPGVYEPANANIQAHVASAHAPSNAEQNVNADWNAGSGDAQILNKPTLGDAAAKNTGTTAGTVAAGDHAHAQLHDRQHSVTAAADHTFPGGTTTFLRADGTFAAPGGGSDPWTYVRLASNFPTTSATAVAVTGLNFTPAANQRYEVYGMFMLRTATATVGPRPGCTWNTGNTDGVAMFELTSAAGTQVLQNGNVNAAVLCPVGGLPNTTQSWPAQLDAMLIVGASPSGNFQITLASETAGTTVTMQAQSFIRYRTIP